MAMIPTPMRRGAVVSTRVGQPALAALAAAAIGLVLVLGTGFAPSETVHNAAHDARHSAAFPCH